MNLSLYLVLVLLGSVGTFVVLVAGAKGSVAGVTVNRRLGIVMSGVALMLWGVIAVNSYEVVVYSGGQEFTRQYEEMAWIATAGGAVAIYSLFQATVEEINATGGI